MKIVYIGYGSLINHHEDLRLRGDFQTGGPVLPLEFSRISKRGDLEECLTLAIDVKNGTLNETFFAESRHTDLTLAIDELAAREGATSRKSIGFINLIDNTVSARAVKMYSHIVEEIKTWARSKGFDGVVWSSFRPNFEKKTNFAFDVLTAFNYIRFLPPAKRVVARNYINSTHQNIQTPLRRVMLAQI